MYTWSSRAQETPVAAEYIIMEKVNGVPLESVYREMEVSDRFAVTKAVARYQKDWTSASFEDYGSLYYNADLDTQGQQLRCHTSRENLSNTSRFAIGPATGRDWNDDGRYSIAFDRGPCEFTRCSTSNRVVF